MKSALPAAATSLMCLSIHLAAAPGDSATWTKQAGGADVVSDQAGAACVLQTAAEEPPRAAMLFKYNAAGRQVWRRNLTADGVDPGRLLVDSTGALIVAGTTTARYSSRGELLQKVAVPGEFDVVDADTLPGGGVIVVRYDGSVSLLSRNLTVRWSVSRPSSWHPNMAAVAADGSIWLGGYSNQWIPDPLGGGASHNLAVIRQIAAATGESVAPGWISTRDLQLGDMAASPDGTVVAVGEGFYPDGDPWITGAQILKVNAGGYVEWRVGSTDLHQDIQFSAYAEESKGLIDRNGTVFVGYVSGNTDYDEADGEPNGVAFVKLSRRGAVQWYHRFQEPAVTMRTPQMAFDFTGDLVIAAAGSINHTQPYGNWSRVFRLQPNGMRTNEVEPLPQFFITSLSLASGFVPVLTGYHGGSSWDTSAPETARLSVLTQLPRGPLVAGAPRRSRDGTSLSVPAIARRGPLRWQWLMDDRPVPGATTSTIVLPPDDNPWLTHRAFSVIVSDSTGTVETPVLVVPDRGGTITTR